MAELNAQGVKVKGKVYLGSTLIAEQGENASGARWVEWKHENPLTGTNGVSDSTAYYQADEAGERDPVGVAFGPPTLLFPAEGLPDSRGPALLYDTGVPDGRCTWYGMAIDCAEAYHMMERGFAEQCPQNDCGPRRMTVHGRLTVDGVVIGENTRQTRPFGGALEDWERAAFAGSLNGRTFTGHGPRDALNVIVGYSRFFSGEGGLEGVDSPRLNFQNSFAPQDTYGWKTAADNLEKSRAKPQGLSKCVKDFLSGYFDRGLLDKITVGEGYVPPGNDAITINNHVTFRKGRLDQKSFGGILLIAHEVQHSVQYQAMGMRVFLALYGTETARLMSSPAIQVLLATDPKAGQKFIHDSLSLEDEAIKKERKIADSFNFTEKYVLCP